MTVVSKNNRIWIGRYDLSTYIDSIDSTLDVEALDDTTFGSLGHRSRAAGLLDFMVDLDGLVEFGAGYTDAVMFAEMTAGTGLPFASIPVPGGAVTAAEPSAENDLVWLTFAKTFRYAPGGAVGTLFRFSAHLEATEEPVSGTLMVPRPSAARTSSATSTARQVGAVAAGERLFAGLHIFAGSGGNLDVDIRSDDNSGMTTPTTRHSFTTATAAGEQWMTPLDGAITDDYWDVDYTISAGSFDFAVTLGIA